MSEVKKWLYFSAQADENSLDGIDDSCCLSADNLVSIAPSANNAVTLTFKSVKNNHSYLGYQANHDTVVLTTVVGDAFEVANHIIRLINSGPHSDGFLIIADDMTTTDSATSALNDLTVPAIYCHKSITAVSSINIADAGYAAIMPSLGIAKGTPSVIAAGALAVNTHYTNAETAAKAYTIPSASDGNPGDWITVTYIDNIANGNLHSYTTTTDTGFAQGSMIRVQPHDATRIGVVDVAAGSADNILKITGLSDGDGGIGTTIKFTNMTGSTNGWAVDATVLGQGACTAASATTVFA